MNRNFQKRIYEIRIGSGDKYIYYRVGNKFEVNGESIEIVEIYLDEPREIETGNVRYCVDALVNNKLEIEWKYSENMPVVVTNFLDSQN